MQPERCLVQCLLRPVVNTVCVGGFMDWLGHALDRRTHREGTELCQLRQELVGEAESFHVIPSAISCMGIPLCHFSVHHFVKLERGFALRETPCDMKAGLL